MSVKDKKDLTKNAIQSVKKRTEDLIEDDDFDIDAEIDEAALFEQSSTIQVKNSGTSRRRLEDYLEERRLRRELSDDFDF